MFVEIGPEDIREAIALLLEKRGLKVKASGARPIRAAYNTYKISDNLDGPASCVQIKTSCMFGSEVTGAVIDCEDVAPGLPIPQNPTYRTNGD